MKFKVLCEMQRELDDYIIKEKKLQKSHKDMLNALFCATYSEILEVIEADEKGSELIDVLHFVLSIGYRLHLEELVAIPVEDVRRINADVEMLFSKTAKLMDRVRAFKFWSEKDSDSTYIIVNSYFNLFITLWSLLLDEYELSEKVVKAYKEKYEINIKRQKENY